MQADSPDGHGLWIEDTRFLSEYRLLVDGKPPEPVSVVADEGALVFEMKADPFVIRVERFVQTGLHERITISNPSSTSAGAHLDVVFAADFAAMLRVRSVLPRRPSQPIVETPGWQSLVLRESGSETHVTQVVARPEGKHHRVELEPGQEFVMRIDFMPGNGEEVKDFDGALQRIHDSYHGWSAECTRFQTDNLRLNELIEQSLDDLRMLCERYSTGVYPTAGLPWFAVPFGRDALFTSMFALPVNPEIARGALRFLAAHQGQRDNPETEEQPGKILHEVRSGEVVESGLWPNILYGTVDATPLYMWALTEAHDWTGDDALLRELWPAADRALAWCLEYGDSDGDGWLDYRGGRPKNQSWKDSDDSLTHTDGAAATNPAAPCEVQAYYYRGLMGMSRVRPELKAHAEKIRDRFNKDFWMRDQRFVAQAIDGSHKPVMALTSNPGHCIWAGILADDKAKQVGTRLMQPDLWSGWGIRTLSSGASNYDACSYHNGSVWPHDSAVAAAGLRRAGCAREAEQVVRAILEAGIAFPDRRLPELWCGTPRVADELPDDYRNSCSPQAWAAAAVFSLLTTLLGLEADAPHGRLRIDPLATPLFNHLEVTGLHFKGERIDFAVDGDRVKMGRVPSGIKVQK